MGSKLWCDYRYTESEEAKRNYLRTAECLSSSTSIAAKRHWVIDRGDGSESPKVRKGISRKNPSKFRKRPGILAHHHREENKQMRKVKSQKQMVKKMSASTPKGLGWLKAPNNIFHRNNQSQFKQKLGQQSLRETSQHEYNPFSKSLKSIPSFDDMLPEKSREELTIESKADAEEVFSDSDKELHDKIRTSSISFILSQSSSKHIFNRFSQKLR